MGHVEISQIQMRDNFRLSEVNRFQVLIPLAFFILLFVSLYFYLPLMFQVPTRAPSIYYFRTFMLPLALVHIASCICFALLLPGKVSRMFVFWLVSLLLVLIFGGVSHLLAFFLFLILALCLLEFGAAVTRTFLGEEQQQFGLSLGIGILSLSLLSSYLSSFKLLHFNSLLLIFIAIWIFLLLTKQIVFVQRLKNLKEELQANWNISTIIAIEGLFLLCAYMIVDCTAPENASDSARFYWPYIKLLKHNSGFFHNPYQWSYVVPQACLTYVGSIYVLFGAIVVRWSMFLVWITLIALIVRGKVNAELGLKVSVAIVLGSLPLLLRPSTTLMNDSFVCLVILVLCIVCIENKVYETRRLYFAIGVISGLAWATKFSTPLYTAPAMVYVLCRSIKVTGWFQTIKRFSILVVGLLLGCAPWLWNLQQQTKNPFFPLFSSFFYSDLWPSGIDFGNLENFKLPDGLRGLLLWPIELTYNTHSYVEGFDGELGLILPFLFLLLIPAINKMNSSAKLFVLFGITGTLILWTKTIYIRYWLPGLCLLTAAAVPAAVSLFRKNIRWKVSFCVVSMFICFAQIPFEMLMSFTDPLGFPIDVYSGKISEEQYIERSYPGFQKFQKHLSAANEKFPRMWFTDYEGAGHMNVEPMEAALWELRRHGINHPRDLIQYLHSKECKYWVVNKSGGQAAWFQLLGLSPFLWLSGNEIDSKGNNTLYKMATQEEALHLYDSRANSATELLINGGFEKNGYPVKKHWLFEGDTEWDDQEPAIKLPPGSALSQTIPLPPSLNKILITIKSQTKSSPEEAKFSVAVLWKKHGTGTFHQDKLVFIASHSFQVDEMLAAVPSKAAWVELYISNAADSQEIMINEVHVISQ